MRLLKNNRRKNRLILKLKQELDEVKNKFEDEIVDLNRDKYEFYCRESNLNDKIYNLQQEVYNLQNKLADAQEPFRKEIETLLEIKRKYFDLVRTLKLDKNDKRKT